MRSVDRPAMKRSALLFALLSAVLGCTQAVMHRPDSVVRQSDYTLAFIEFDDQGEPWAPAQLERAIQVIDEAHADGKRTTVLLFVHGWQNDASKREDRRSDNNVEGFQRLLSTTRDLLTASGESQDDGRVIGVYIGWRGRSTKGLLWPMSFYSRRGAGQRMAGTSTASKPSEINRIDPGVFSRTSKSWATSSAAAPFCPAMGMISGTRPSRNGLIIFASSVGGNTKCAEPAKVTNAVRPPLRMSISSLSLILARASRVGSTSLACILGVFSNATINGAVSAINGLGILCQVGPAAAMVANTSPVATRSTGRRPD